MFSQLYIEALFFAFDLDDFVHLQSLLFIEAKSSVNSCTTCPQKLHDKKKHFQSLSKLSAPQSTRLREASIFFLIL